MNVVAKADKSKDPRKQAQQERSRATVDAVFEAMDRVVRREGIDEFSIAQVATEARVARASVYDYFPTREALVAAWEERLISAEMARFAELLAELMANPPPFERSVIRLIEAVMDAFARQAAAYGYRDTFGSLGLHARSRVRGEMTEQIVAMMAGALAQAPDRERLRVDRLDVAARLVVHTVLNLARVLAGAPFDAGELHVHRRELARMVYRYLLRDPADVPHDDDAS
ncbi:MAG: TetR/AcrR family transcriptional regulator [Deltaproteobacteria bacterium]|nr:TetR/AcrR family transcriptional regulator [Deltaproteobacteria bacterium]